jgi:hypothetical protein
MRTETQPLDRAASAESGGEHIELAAVEHAIQAASNLEEWYRDKLLAEVRSLTDFYRAHERI